MYEYFKSMSKMSDLMTIAHPDSAYFSRFWDEYAKFWAKIRRRSTYMAFFREKSQLYDLGRK